MFSRVRFGFERSREGFWDFVLGLREIVEFVWFLGVKLSGGLSFVLGV